MKAEAAIKHDLKSTKEPNRVTRLTAALSNRLEKDEDSRKLKQFNRFACEKFANGSLLKLREIVTSTGIIRDTRVMLKYLDRSQLPGDGIVFRASMRGDDNTATHALLYDSEFTLIAKKELV